MRLVEQRKFTPLFMSDTVSTAVGDSDTDGGGGPAGRPQTDNPYDLVEGYTVGMSLNGSDSDPNWNPEPAPYVVVPSFLGVQVFDDVETYTASSSINGQGTGTWNDAAAVVVGAFLGVQASDDIESYSVAASIDGGTGGSGWGGAFVVV